MVETLIAHPFPPVVNSALEESASAFFNGSCGLAHIPESDLDDSEADAGIMSTISFVGDIQWAFALAFAESSAVTIARTFAGFEIPFDSPDMGDVIGEIVNVIAGDVVRRLAKEEVTAQMSLPTTVRGRNVGVLVPTDASTTRFRFAGANGNCCVSLIATANVHSIIPRPEAEEPERIEVPQPVATPAAPEPATDDESAAKTAAEAALAAWTAEMERQLAEQDAAEAALRAAGGGATAQAPAGPAPAGPARHGLLVLTLVFACGGWGAAVGQLVTNKKAAQHPPASATDAHGTADAGHKDPAAHIDGLIRGGQFEKALRQCLEVPKDAPGLGGTALALREALCLEGMGQWVEAGRAYERAEADPSVVVQAVARLGHARCVTQEDSYVIARALTNRVLLRSGHPALRGLPVREEVAHLRGRIDRQAAGAQPLPRDASARPLLSTSASNCLEWLATAHDAPVPARDVFEVHRILGAPGALQVTVGLSQRPVIAVLRALASTAGWKVEASDRVVAALNWPVGPLEVDHLPLPELLKALTEHTEVSWAVEGDVLRLTTKK